MSTRPALPRCRDFLGQRPAEAPHTAQLKVGWRPLEIFPMQEKPRCTAHSTLLVHVMKCFVAKSEDRECPIEQELFDWSPLQRPPSKQDSLEQHSLSGTI